MQMKHTVGEQLRSARESRGFSLVEVVKATHIRLNYLQELENDHPELFNSIVQARGFLRLYASFLGIPSAPLIEQWQKVVETELAIEEENAPIDGSALKDSSLEMEDHQQDLEEEGGENSCLFL